MDYNIPDKYYKFTTGWQREYNFEEEANQFSLELDKAQKENDIQHYIKNGSKWFIPAALLKDYDFGHHEAYITSEQELGAEYRADYMIIGKNSLGHQIILVEFEDINVDYKLKKSNAETESVRKGMTQIRDWKRWIDDNRNYFLSSCGLSHIDGNIPAWGFHYCLVVSRRARMEKDVNANLMRGQIQRETPGLHIVTYDRLVDNIRRLGNGF